MRNESGDGPFTVMDGLGLPMLFPPACKVGAGEGGSFSHCTQISTNN